jgi:uncharacterized membrane protein
MSWRRHLAGALVLAVLAHLAFVWAVPRVIMWRLAANAPPESKQPGTMYFPPMTDHTQRRIVMPSPDLLYTSCAFDVSERPMRIRADPQAPHYWSIALYAANSDNFFVVNDRQAAGAPFDLVLSGPRAAAPALPPGARAVRSPTSRGLLLMRVLVTDDTHEQPMAEAARRTLRCDPL